MVTRCGGAKIQVGYKISRFSTNKQGDHLSGKPGNVREFDSCQGNDRDFTENQGNVRELSGKKSCQGKVA